MLVFRFIIEGSNLELPRSYGEERGSMTGFFTTRKARAKNVEIAQDIVLRALVEEWQEHSPTLAVLDRWRVGLLELRRAPNKGHVFFNDEESRYKAASIEAVAASAPATASIWALAELDRVEDE